MTEVYNGISAFVKFKYILLHSNYRILKYSGLNL